MIRDDIEMLERNYRFDYQGEPTILLINPEIMAYLIEELDLDPIEPLDTFRGMQVIIDESAELELHSYASFQTREYQ